MVSSSSQKQSFPIISQTAIHPSTKSNTPDLKLSVSDLPMLSCNYIQKGVLLYKPPAQSISEFVQHAHLSLAETLTHFPPLAGRLKTDPAGYVYITCNDAGVDFFHVDGSHLHVSGLLKSSDGNAHVPDVVKCCFPYDGMVSYEGHFRPILAVQVTELEDGLFIGCAVNHAVTDGTSFWNFFNTFAEISKGVEKITKKPDFSRDSVLISRAVLQIPEGGPQVTFSADAPVSERIFKFTRESLLRLKEKVNNTSKKFDKWGIDTNAELMGKQSNDSFKFVEEKVTPLVWLRNVVSRDATTNANNNSTVEISSFQSLSALLWRAVTRARKMPESKMTTFRMAVNCRQRLEPKLNPLYLGNAIQSIPTYAEVREVLGNDLKWCAEELNKNVKAHGDATIRQYVKNWERDPRCFPLGNFDGAMLTMGSSPWFPMYDNDFGWGRPIAVRSGRGNKFDGKISAFPGREGGGSVDLEVILAPETMAGLESDPEFMQYVSSEVY